MSWSDYDTTTCAGEPVLQDLPLETGIFSFLGEPDIGDLIWVRWPKRAKTHRYVQFLAPPVDGAIGLIYEKGATGRALRQLTAADRVSRPRLLRVLARYGPYTRCCACGYNLTHIEGQTFGLGPTCFANKWGVEPKLARIMHKTLVEASLDQLNRLANTGET